jgi:hypothetical protein
LRRQDAVVADVRADVEEERCRPGLRDDELPQGRLLVAPLDLGEEAAMAEEAAERASAHGRTEHRSPESQKQCVDPVAPDRKEPAEAGPASKPGHPSQRAFHRPGHASPCAAGTTLFIVET